MGRVEPDDRWALPAQRFCDPQVPRNTGRSIWQRPSPILSRPGTQPWHWGRNPEGSWLAARVHAHGHQGEHVIPRTGSVGLVVTESLPCTDPRWWWSAITHTQVHRWRTGICALLEEKWLFHHETCDWWGPWGHAVRFPWEISGHRGDTGWNQLCEGGHVASLLWTWAPSSVKWDRVVEKIGSEALLALTSYKFIISFLLDPSG